jgi:ligand-binding SRPBCC domain-containing protein
MALHSSLLSAILGCVPSFRIASRLRAPTERVWAHATSMAGINHELAPLLRMTHPPRMTALGDISPPLGTPLFRSIILLFGVLPIDFDDVTLEAIEPGRGFRERSHTLSQREWIHERSLEPTDGGVRVADRITFEPKIPGAGAILAPLLHLVFRNRHRKLVGLFGGEVEGLHVL